MSAQAAQNENMKPKTFKSLNPATDEVEATFDGHSDTDIEQALKNAQAANAFQKTQSFADRAAKMRKVAEDLRANAKIYGAMMTSEMGKPIAQAEAEVVKCAGVCDFFADNAQKLLADEKVSIEGKKRAFVAYRPIGTILAVMPWNFPFWQVIRFAAPALMAGNTGILKHASNVPACALELEKIFVRAGFENHEFQTLLIGSDKIEDMIADPRIAAATLTGSEAAGSAVGATAGKHIKKTVLELGGSDAFIVMPSADLDTAVDHAAKGRLLNNGQSCIAAKRYIVHADIYEDFKAKIVARFEALKLGNPADESVDVGPVSSKAARDELLKQVEDSVKAGAKLLVGGTKPEGAGAFIVPGILADIPKEAPAYAQELFGPIASLYKVASLDEAIALANSSEFGLGSAIFTNEESEKEQAIRELEAGGTFINHMYASDQNLPFGGVKKSGYGRELTEFGLKEFVNIKSVLEA